MPHNYIIFIKVSASTFFFFSLFFLSSLSLFILLVSLFVRFVQFFLSFFRSFLLSLIRSVGRSFLSFHFVSFLFIRITYRSVLCLFILFFFFAFLCNVYGVCAMICDCDCDWQLALNSGWMCMCSYIFVRNI